MRPPTDGTVHVATPIPPLGAATPWDEPEAYGVGRAFFLTWWQVIIRPRETLARVPARRGALTRPFSFALACGLVRWVTPHLPRFLAVSREVLLQVQEGANAVVAIRGMVQLLAFVVGLPLAWILARVALLGGLDAVLLRLVRAGRGGMEATLRGACFSSAPEVLGAVPHLWWGTELWQAGLRFIAYRDIHRNSGLRTFGVLLSVVLTLALYLLGGLVDVAVSSGLEEAAASLGLRS